MVSAFLSHNDWQLYHHSQAVAIPYNDPFLPGAHLYKYFGEFPSPLASALPAPPQWLDCVCRDDTLLMGKDTWCGETVKETRNLSTKLIPILWFSRILKIGKSSKRIRLHSLFTKNRKTNTRTPFPTWSDPWILSPRSVNYLNFLRTEKINQWIFLGSDKTAPQGQEPSILCLLCIAVLFSSWERQVMKN